MSGLSGKEEPGEDQRVLEPTGRSGHPPGFGNDGDRKGAGLQAAIGREVRSIRIRSGISARELATAADISLSMLSRLENGSISPSLDTLQALSTALGVSPGALFRGFEKERSAVFVKAGGGVKIERPGGRPGYQCNLLGHAASGAGELVVEAHLITLSQPSDEVSTLRYEGIGLIFMLEGEMVYRGNECLYRMSPGDSLLFNANVPHGRYELTEVPIRYLSVISCRRP